MKKPKVRFDPTWKLSRRGQLLRVSNGDGTAWETFDLPYGWETSSHPLRYGRAAHVMVEGKPALRYRLAVELVGRVGDALVASELIVFV